MGTVTYPWPTWAQAVMPFGLVDASGNPISSTNPAAHTLYDANGKQIVFNNDGITVQTLAAVGPGTTVSQTQINPSGRGVMICVNITAISGAGTLTVSIVAVDPVSSGTTALLTSTALGTVAKTFLFVYPGITATSNVSASAVLPRSWAISSTEAGASTTVSATISASLIV